MLGLLGSRTEVSKYNWTNAFAELDITLDPVSSFSDIACYASWPLKAYIKGFPLSHSLSLSYTSQDACSLVSYAVPFTNCFVADPLIETLHHITLKVSGGTVKCALADLDAHRRLLRITEAWEQEDA